MEKQMEAIVEAFRAGREYAKSLQPGDIFRGSHGEAEHRGLKGQLRSAFGCGALDELDAVEVWTEGPGSLRITRIVRKEAAQ